VRRKPDRSQKKKEIGGGACEQKCQKIEHVKTDGYAFRGKKKKQREMKHVNFRKGGKKL